mmetsp:Transcript_9661/g.21461  ORF Transcript_9661/g.21461 Transcript_9661/m.21461 type:complete len:95 (+) Transcript_9661:229-513(+)
MKGESTRIVPPGLLARKRRGPNAKEANAPPTTPPMCAQLSITGFVRPNPTFTTKVVVKESIPSSADAPKNCYYNIGRLSKKKESQKAHEEVTEV